MGVGPPPTVDILKELFEEEYGSISPPTNEKFETLIAKILAFITNSPGDYAKKLKNKFIIEESKVPVSAISEPDRQSDDKHIRRDPFLIKRYILDITDIAVDKLYHMCEFLYSARAVYSKQSSTSNWTIIGDFSNTEYQNNFHMVLSKVDNIKQVVPYIEYISLSYQQELTRTEPPRKNISEKTLQLLMSYVFAATKSVQRSWNDMEKLMDFKDAEEKFIKFNPYV